LLRFKSFFTNGYFYSLLSVNTVYPQPWCWIDISQSLLQDKQTFNLVDSLFDSTTFLMNNIYKTRESTHNTDDPTLYVKIRIYLTGMYVFSDLSWYFQVQCPALYLSSLDSYEFLEVNSYFPMHGDYGCFFLS